MSEPAIGALYLHVPFCVGRCAYCDFTTRAVGRDDPLVARYFGALSSAVGLLASEGLLSGVRTAYVGGGTPTIGGEALCSLVASVRDACPDLTELSCEANPESLDDGLPARLRDVGATRVSLGVQSLDDRELAALGRVHDARRAEVAARAVLSSGLDLSCDLMCGIPLQDRESFSRSLDAVVSLGAHHVSVYPLTVEDGTPLQRACESGQSPWPDQDLQADLMLAAQERLAQAGMSRYEVASYALPGHACRHNQAYWDGTSYLGIGTGASSMLTPAQLDGVRRAVPLDLAGEDDPTLRGVVPDAAARVRFRMTDDARALCGALEGGGALRAEAEFLDAREAAAEDMMLALRTSRGMGSDLLAQGRATGMGEELDRAVDEAVSSCLARLLPQGGVAPTQRGWLLGNELYGLFWDLAHPR